MPKKSKSWDFVRIKEVVSEPHEDYRYAFKFRINLSYEDYQRHKAAIVALLQCVIASDPRFAVIYRFKTPRLGLIEKELVKAQPNYVGAGQFTIYAQVGACTRALVLAFSAALQVGLSALGVSAVRAMLRDRALTANISIRAGGMRKWLGKSSKVSYSFSSSKIRHNADLLRCYLMLMHDSTLHHALDGRPVREVEFDDIHLLLKRCYVGIEQSPERSAHWLELAEDVAYCRGVQYKKMKGAVSRSDCRRLEIIMQKDYKSNLGVEAANACHRLICLLQVSPVLGGLQLLLRASKKKGFSSADNLTDAIDPSNKRLTVAAP